MNHSLDAEVMVFPVYPCLLYTSRAILAGYNCSNVDVRSSRYDAVIDYKGMIFKVQVKGISGSTVSFKDRDRGGRGIDTHNDRNIGKRITSVSYTHRV